MKGDKKTLVAVVNFGLEEGWIPAIRCRESLLLLLLLLLCCMYFCYRPLFLFFFPRRQDASYSGFPWILWWIYNGETVLVMSLE